MLIPNLKDYILKYDFSEAPEFFMEIYAHVENHPFRMNNSDRYLIHLCADSQPFLTTEYQDGDSKWRENERSHIWFVVVGNLELKGLIEGFKACPLFVGTDHTQIMKAYADGFKAGKQSQREEQRGVWRKS